MSEEKRTRFIVFTVQYESKNEDAVERLLKDIDQQIASRYGKVRRVYQGSDKSVVSALEKVLKLAE